MGHDVFVPTPQDVVDKMLELAKIKKDETVYDLGCGDGRIVVTAARTYGCKAYGCDVDPECVKLSWANVEKHGVGKLVTIEHKDLFKLDLSGADVVTLYLLPRTNERLAPHGQRISNSLKSEDFREEGRIQHTTDHLASKAVVYGMTLQERHREAS
jgi:ribosomal protein L11 methylase PrmA